MIAEILKISLFLSPLLDERFISIEGLRPLMSEEDEIVVGDVGEGEEIGLKVADWLGKKKNFPEGIVEGEVEAVTEKAVLIGEDWIPKSQVEDTWLL